MKLGIQPDLGADKLREHYEKYGSYPSSFVDPAFGRTFENSKDVQKFLSSLFGDNIKKVYAELSTRPESRLSILNGGATSLDLSSETYYIVTRSGKIIRITNSEWGDITIC